MAGKQEGGADIAIHHLVIVLDTGSSERLVVAHTNIVDQDIQGAEVLLGHRHSSYRRLLFTGISHDRHGLPPCGVDRLHQLSETLLPSRCQD